VPGVIVGRRIVPARRPASAPSPEPRAVELGLAQVFGTIRVSTAPLPGARLVTFGVSIPAEPPCFEPIGDPGDLMSFGAWLAEKYVLGMCQKAA
jgi:hypothetical protein